MVKIVEENFFSTAILENNYAALRIIQETTRYGQRVEIDASFRLQTDTLKCFMGIGIALFSR